MPIPPDDEFTELIDATIPRVDLVDKAANGLPILLAKQQGDNGRTGLMAPEFVRDLIAKAKYDSDDRKRMAGHEAMKDGSYPIADREDLSNAIHAVGRGNGDHDAIRRHVIARAKVLGATSMIPDNWAADGSIKKGEVPMELDDGVDGLDPTVILAAPDEDAPGDPNDPGSPAWEAIDAATARKWTAILTRAKSALGVMSDREMLEAAAADPDDAGNAMDLDDAACAIDYAIAVLAPFAWDEQAEVDCGTAEMETVGKALAGFDTAPLDVIESLTHVTKAGRTLSAANEQAIRHAVASLEKVLASLPPAPPAPDTKERGQEVAKKETDVPQTDTPATETAAEAVEPVGKADGDTEGKTPMVAVYDAKGVLVGIVDPAEITPISGADGGDTDPGDDGEGSNAAAAADLTPAPPADAGTPADATDDGVAKQTDTTDATTDAATGDDVAKQTDTDSDDVLKSSITTLVKSLIDEHSATQTAELTKQREAVLELAGIVDTLKGQILALEEQPAEPRVFANGAVPPAQLRGQDRGARPVDTAKARELKKSLYSGTAAEQNQAAVEMQSAAIEALQAIHQRRA